MKLLNKSKNTVVAEELKVASTFWKRAKGLLFTDELPVNESLMIKSCNSIHTFFMKFPIDVIFITKGGQVKSVKKNVGPGKLILPVLGACEVIESAVGTIERAKVEVGDQIDVVS